jgi:hypothetical protein
MHQRPAHAAVRCGLAPLCAGHDHIDRAAPATETDEPLMPVRNRSLGAVSFGHFGGIGLDSMAAFPTTDDEPNTGSSRTAECHRRAGFGFHLTASAVSSAARRLVALRLEERFAFRLRSDHVANLSQVLNARRGKVAITVYNCRKLLHEKGGLFVGKVQGS